MTEALIRHAATVILMRDAATAPRILVGQRGDAAAFMPSKFVFPGGAVDESDADIPLKGLPSAKCQARLRSGTEDLLAATLLRTAIREVWEETGLLLGCKDSAAPLIAPSLPPDWQDFLRTGTLPSAEGFSFVFRAITPPGRPRRFDARFFLVNAARIHGDPDDFSRASDELSHLHWAPLTEIRDLNLPFITEVVLAEVENLLGISEPTSVPFFDNTGPVPTFRRI